MTALSAAKRYAENPDDWHPPEPGEVAEVLECLESAEAERDRLRKALEHYGRHLGGLTTNQPCPALWRDKCDCGLRAALVEGTDAEVGGTG